MAPSVSNKASSSKLAALPSVKDQLASLAARQSKGQTSDPTALSSTSKVNRRLPAVPVFASTSTSAEASSSQPELATSLPGPIVDTEDLDDDVAMEPVSGSKGKGKAKGREGRKVKQVRGQRKKKTTDIAKEKAVERSARIELKATMKEVRKTKRNRAKKAWE